MGDKGGSTAKLSGSSGIKLDGTEVESWEIEYPDSGIETARDVDMTLTVSDFKGKYLPRGTVEIQTKWNCIIDAHSHVDIDGLKHELEVSIMHPITIFDNDAGERLQEEIECLSQL